MRPRLFAKRCGTAGRGARTAGTLSGMTTASAKLDAAIRAMPAVDSPISSLKIAWPEMGTYVLLGWAEAIERDLRLADEGIAAAKAAGPCEDGRIAVEHSYWRLGSARDRLATLAA